jgi:hypothetical protein
MTSFQVSYFWVHHESRPGIAWNLLAELPAVTETEFVRHVRFPRPLRVELDGRSGRGVVRLPRDDSGGE